MRTTSNLADLPYDDYVETPTTEEKLVSAHEELDLEPWEISEITQRALSKLPEGFEDGVGEIFDLVYDAITEALDRKRG